MWFNLGGNTNGSGCGGGSGLRCLSGRRVGGGSWLCGCDGGSGGSIIVPVDFVFSRSWNCCQYEVALCIGKGVQQK